MTAPNAIPRQIEDVLVTHRRGFLRSAGLLAVSFGAGSWATETDAQSSAVPMRQAAIALVSGTLIAFGSGAGTAVRIAAGAGSTAAGAVRGIGRT